MSKTKKYSGKLGTFSRPEIDTGRLAGSRLMSPTTEAEERALREKNSLALLRHELKGVALLLKHYDLDQDEAGAYFALLALALARDHVPYFQQQQKRRGPKPNAKRMATLEIDVALRRAAGDRSDAAALEHLSLHVEPWTRFDAADLARRRREHAKDPTFDFIRAIKKLPNAAEVLNAMRRSLMSN